MLPKHFAVNYNSCASEKNQVVCGKYRFTILTESLIRLEYDKTECFEDRATQCVINRQIGEVVFTVKKEEDLLIIKTNKLTLRFVPSLGFTSDGLCISVNDIQGAVWHFGDSQETLKGTYRTLDGIFVERSVELGEGVCSRRGFAFLDDSQSLVILPDGWFEPRKDDIIDIYFFGYGHNYIGATKALYKLTGNPPLLPSYVFGNWWSRFKDYGEEGYKELVASFKEEDIPFSVFVIDMYWHLYNDNPNWWTGYSWNTEAFPDYKRFLNWLHEQGLHTSLNLHPAQGIQEHENMYRDMAIAMGIDPDTKQTVEFQAENKDFWKPYFEILHHPYENNGVDFWWMDWQQGTESKMKGLDPLWILNYYHSLDAANNKKRPMYFSRYSGPGSQRFYVGFSGDTYINWDAFQFEPYFTATSSNIAYPYWSHDIGGFQHGIRDDELYTRWVQFGVFSPILRIHSTNYDFVCKEPWNYGAVAERAVCNALRLRHKLFPYLYTMNYITYTENIALCQPLYYYYPEEENAYKYKNEYFFGSKLLVAPVTEKTDPKTKLAKTDVWLPEGKWIDFFTGLVYDGNREITIYNDMYAIPVFARAGAIIPMNKYIKGDNTVGSKADMEINIYGGASGNFTLYEDEGDNNNYLKGDFVKTVMTLNYGEKEAVFTISPANSNVAVIPEKHNYTVNLIGFSKELSVEANGKILAVCYDDKNNIHSITIENIYASDGISLVIKSGGSLESKNENWQNHCFDIMLQAETASFDKKRLFDTITNINIPFKEKLEELKAFEDIDPNLKDPIKNLLMLSQN